MAKERCDICGGRKSYKMPVSNGGVRHKCFSDCVDKLVRVRDAQKARIATLEAEKAALEEAVRGANDIMYCRDDDGSRRGDWAEGPVVAAALKGGGDAPE